MTEQQQANVQKGNGLGIAAFICGILGCLCALMPLAFFAGVPLAVCAIVLGSIGVFRAMQLQASNAGMALIAVLLGLIAGGFGIAHGADFARKMDPVYQSQRDCVGRAAVNGENINACFE